MLQIQMVHAKPQNAQKSMRKARKTRGYSDITSISPTLIETGRCYLSPAHAD